MDDMLHKNFHHLTLMELINRLRELHPGVMVNLFPSVDSYRAFYDRVVIGWDPDANDAHWVANTLERQIGGRMLGYKGNAEFPIEDRTLVHVANSVREYGPEIIGIEWDGTVVTYGHGY